MGRLEWRIRETGDGEFMAEYGAEHKGGVSAPSGIGYTMPAFIVYQSCRCRTRKEAERYIKRQGGRLK